MKAFFGSYKILVIHFLGVKMFRHLSLHVKKIQEFLLKSIYQKGNNQNVSPYFDDNLTTKRFSFS